MDKYQKKQFKIVLAYLFILVIIIGIVYLWIKPKLPSCSDGIQNQGEAGIDCGDPCSLCPWQVQEDLEIILTEALEIKDNYVDLVAKIKNPNSDFGAKSFSYIFNIYDSEENLIVSKKGSSYILPRETKYIIEQKILAESDIFKIEFEVDNVDWKKLEDYQEPELLIRNPSIDQSGDVSKLMATLENRSNYNFHKIDVWAILFGENSKILGIGKIELYTIFNKENRYFEISWFSPLSEEVVKTDIRAGTNVFLDENFMKRYYEY